MALENTVCPEIGEAPFPRAEHASFVCARGRQGTWATFLAPLVLAAACMLAGQLYLYRNHFPRVISDGYGYWSYLPSYLIYEDPSFSAFMDAHDGTPEAQGLLRLWNGGLIQKYPMGTAILQAPFFLAADVVARSLGYARDGYCAPYQFFAMLAPGVYALLGLGLLMAALRPYAPPSTLALAATFAFFGTNACHYATFDGSFSHIHSFFLGSALLYVLLAARCRRVFRTLAVGAILGLMLLVRPVNALYFLFVAGWLVFGEYGTEDGLGFRQAALDLAVCGLIAGLIFGLQLVAWRASSDLWMVDSYIGEHFEFGNPHLADFLFSLRKGLFFWHPLYLFCLGGLFFLRRPAGFRLPALGFAAVFTYVSASWSCWWYGGTLGQRVFVDALPILFPGLVRLLDQRRPAARLVAVALCSVLTLHSLFCMCFYWLGVIPGDEAALGHLALGWKTLRALIASFT